MSITPKTNPLMQRLGAKSRQKGYSIIELSIALAIVSIILVTALTGVQRILRTNNLNEELKKANLLVAKLTTLLSSSASTQGVTTSTLASMKVFEDYQVAIDSKNNVATVSASFSGSTVETFPNSDQIDSTPPNTGVLIYFRGLPPEICADFINGISTISSHITTSNDVKTAPSGKVLANTVKAAGTPITLNNLATGCATTATNNKVTVAALITNNTAN